MFVPRAGACRALLVRSGNNAVSKVTKMPYATLTARQEQILRFIAAYADEYGLPPSLREIGAKHGIGSTNAVNDHLRALERKGYLGARRPLITRDLRLTEKAKRFIGGEPVPAAERYMVVINREGTVEARVFDALADAQAYFDTWGAQWTETYLCVVMNGPGKPVMATPEPPAIRRALERSEGTPVGESSDESVRVDMHLPEGTSDPSGHEGAGAEGCGAQGVDLQPAGIVFDEVCSGEVSPQGEQPGADGEAERGGGGSGQAGVRAACGAGPEGVTQ